MDTSEFFDTAIERYKIMVRKNSGAPREEWTDDPIFKEWRFCNVHREDDRTTIWFRENIRKYLSGRNALEATFIFRWFNRISTGERIKDLIINPDGTHVTWDTEECRRRLMGVAPVVTGAYMLKTPDYLPKLDGVLEAIDTGLLYTPDITLTDSLQQAWIDIKQIPWIGSFTGYEIVTDLRWCAPLNNAPDIMTWAAAGPGAARGIKELTGVHYTYGSREGQKAMNDIMQEILSRVPELWPNSWRPWELREVEHWLCEFFKYKKAERGLRLKRRYRPGAST